MKGTQITGLVFTFLAFAYYLTFAHRLDNIEENDSVSLGLGMLLVYFLAFISAILLIPTTIMLWKKTTREHHNYTGFIWRSVLIVNSLLTVLYASIGLWIIGVLLYALATLKYF